MKTEVNEKILNKFNLNLDEDFLTEDFVKYINNLSDSIRKYCKETKNNNQTKTILINSLEKDLSESESIFNVIFNINNIDYNNVQSYNEVSKKINEALKKLKENVNLEEKNLMYFFEDAKIIFRKMKDYKQNKVRKKRLSFGFNTKKNEDMFPERINNQKNQYQKSETNLKLDKNIIFENQKKKIIPVSNRNASHNKNIDNTPLRTVISDDTFKMNITCRNKDIKKCTDINKLLSEIERLNNINKKYELNIRKLNLELKKYQSGLQTIKKPNSFKNLLNKDNDNKEMTHDELSKNKDIIISSLKLEKEKINQKYIKEKEDLNKKILVIEKKLSDEQFKNQELKNENSILINKHELELSQLSKRNTELSKILIDKQNVLLNLQKEILEKTKEIENLKYSIKDSQDNQKFIESIITYLGESSVKNSSVNNRPWNNLNESLNRILENYKNENQTLKIEFHEKIKYYQEQLKKAKNELLEKIEANMENDFKNKKEIYDIKNNFDKKMEEVKHKNKIIDHYLNLCQEANNNLMNRITQINQKVSAKEMKIIQLQEEKQELKEKIEELYNLKDSNNLNDIDLKLKEDNINLNKRLDKQNQINEKLKEELKVISNEHNIYHKRLLSLGIKFIGVHESEISKDEGFDILKHEIIQLKGQNENLKSVIESITKDFLDRNKEKKENDEKYDDENGALKKQYDVLEVLIQMTYRYINDEGNNGNEINLLKKENEKLLKQISKLSIEIVELQKRENKYKILLKNENKTAILSSKNATTNYDEIVNELNKVKKENAQIKKKNSELISQLEKNEIKHNYDNKSEDGFKSNYEEEFDLRKMAKGAKDKIRSQDNNIDYPGIQSIKEKYRELDFYYNSLENMVKNLLLNVHVEPKNKNYIKDLCQFVKFDIETTNKILNNKNNKKV